MARIRKSVQVRRYRKSIIEQTSGFYGRRNRCYALALQASQQSLLYQYRDRKNRKRDWRALWIVRINAAARAIGIKYSVFMDRLNKSDLNINRKMLADIAANEPLLFADIAKKISGQIVANKS